MRILLTVEYDGTSYAGWQRQLNALTVQEVLEDAIYSATGVRTNVVGAGRTDSGVHALGQCAHFDIETKIPPEKLAYALNFVLPEDVRIKESRCVREDFHARKDARGKHYRYTIYNAEHANAVNRHTCAYVRQPLDIEAMRVAASYLKGKHDFKSFQAAGSTPMENTVRTLYKVDVTKIDDYIYIDVVGNGFLYNMVRIIAGTLLDVGRGRRNPNTIPALIQACTREGAGATAPAKGLTLISVLYDHNSLL